MLSSLIKSPAIAQLAPQIHRLKPWLARQWQRLDARWFQLLFLASFLGLGALARDFALTPAQVLLTLASALLTQAAWQWGLSLPGKKSWNGYLSALVSTLGISILVRADSLWVHPLLASLAMSSKYLIRSGAAMRRGHFLNPANLAAFAAWAWLPGAWLSPGQWGFESLAALWFMALGGMVTQRICRWDVSLSFLASWAVLLALRLWLLGYTWNPGAAMWLQQIGNGAVLLFAFFMISDPMTTPQRRDARIGYAVLVALGAFVWQYLLYRPHGLIVVLFAASWLVPLCNRLWPEARFAWAKEAWRCVTGAAVPAYLRPESTPASAGSFACYSETARGIGAESAVFSGLRKSIEQQRRAALWRS